MSVTALVRRPPIAVAVVAVSALVVGIAGNTATASTVTGQPAAAAARACSWRRRPATTVRA